MFSSRDRSADSYYSDAVKDAVINNTNNKRTNNRIFLMLNLSFLVLVTYFGYSYFIKDSSMVQTKVMGVTHLSSSEKVLTETISPKSDIDYANEIEMLDNPSMEEESDYKSQLAEYMSREVESKS